ncbi:MAG TPA: EI24 domain-containing protein [Burkholderiales bacterium]|nr:EI24 domain-containing protein [Burkholderiales bacterium]
MNAVVRSLVFALGNLLHPKMLWLMLWPLLIALALWGTLAIVYWAQLAMWLAGLINQWLTTGWFALQWDLQGAASIAAKILILIMLVPLVQLTALLILSSFGMPAMVDHVAARAYPALERRKGGSLAGSLWNGAVALCGMLLLFIASIPFWLFPPLWPMIPVAVLGWVNQRVLRYDALAEHADAAEMRRVFAGRRGNMYLLGLVLALMAYIPLIGFFAPVLFGLSFIHYLLGELRALRP